MERLSAGTGWMLALLILWLGLVFHLWLAAYFPLSNDEAYAWDWGQNLLLTYDGHPPGIAWVTALSTKWGGGLLAVRLLIPFMQALASFFLLLCLREVHPGWGPRDFMLLAAATVLWPGFALLGVFARPDAGLYPCMTAALWLTLRYRRKMQLNGSQGFCFGALLGIAGLFKLDALPLGLGLGLSLLWLRRRTFRYELTFWFSALGFALLITTQLWLGNFQNDGASIFSYEHPIDQLAWKGLHGLRVAFVFCLFLTPWFGWLLLRVLQRLIRERGFFPAGVPLIILGSSMPLILVMSALSIAKPVLLHGIMPGFWFLLPAAVAIFADELARSKRSWILALLLSVVLPSLLAHRDFRRSLISALDIHAEPIMELTLWPELSMAVQALRKPIVHQLPAHCPMDGFIAGTRWYAVAQLHFHNRRMPTISLDRQHRSFYTFRDRQRIWIDCPVTLVIPEKNFQKKDYEDIVAIESVTPIPLTQHASQKYLAVAGRLIAGPEKVLGPASLKSRPRGFEARKGPVDGLGRDI